MTLRSTITTLSTVAHSQPSHHHTHVHVHVDRRVLVTPSKTQAALYIQTEPRAIECPALLAADCNAQPLARGSCRGSARAHPPSSRTHRAAHFESGATSVGRGMRTGAAIHTKDPPSPWPCDDPERIAYGKQVPAVSRAVRRPTHPQPLVQQLQAICAGVQPTTDGLPEPVLYCRPPKSSLRRTPTVR